MIKINVLLNNKSWKKYIENPKAYTKDKIKLLNKGDNFFRNKNIYFSLLLSGSKEIRTINKKFRKKNKITDVLSFPFYERKEIKNFLKKKTPFYLGDIIINLDKIIVQSNNKEKIRVKFDKLWIHGFVHLLGYRHKLNKDYAKMSKVEKKFFDLVN